MKKKLVIVLTLIVIIYGFILFIIFGTRDNSDKSNNFVIFGNLNLVHGEHSFDKVAKDDIDKYKGTFECYSTGKYLGNYKLTSGEVWNLFDSNGNFVNYDGNLFAVASNLKNNVINFTKSSINDDEKNYILSKYRINNFDNLMNSGAYTFNINNKEYKLIILNNVDNVDFDINKNYNLMLLKNNSKYTEVSFNKKEKTEIYDIIGVVGFNKFRDVYIGFDVLTNFDTDYESDEYTLFKLENNKLKKVISN